MTASRPEGDHDVVVPAASLWRLGADPSGLARSAQAWRELAAQVTATGHDLTGAATTLLAGWAGPAADAYRPHQEQVALSLTAVSTVAGELGSLLDHGADMLRWAQDDLDTAWARLHRGPLTSVAVDTSTAHAHQVRVLTTARLSGLAARLHQQREQLWVHEGAADQGDTADTEWAGTELDDGSAVILDGDQVIVSGTGTGDDIEIGVEAQTGQRFVRVNGALHRVGPDARIVVRAGGGADHVRVTSGAGRVTVLAGDGKDELDGGDGAERLYGGWDDDTIRAGGGADQVYGGAGADYLCGGAGNDHLDGGGGQDIVYGLDGDDTLWGGTGDNVLDGGTGDDLIGGGRDADVLIGGLGRDTLLGGAGADTLLGGDGADTLDGGGGTDRAFRQGDDRGAVEQVTDVATTPLGDVVRIDPGATLEFRARVESDLEALRSTPSGQQMLAALQASHDQHGDTVTITEVSGPPGERGDPRTGAPVGATIRYNPTYTPPGPGMLPLKPLVQLYHELAHAYDDCYDSATAGQYTGADNRGVRNAEREAVGLPVDDDNNPTTPDRLDPDHPYPLTENSLRQDLGLPLRTRY